MLFLIFLNCKCYELCSLNGTNLFKQPFSRQMRADLSSDSYCVINFSDSVILTVIAAEQDWYTIQF